MARAPGDPRRRLGRFTGLDSEEARSRLGRLARCCLLGYGTAGPAAWDAPRGEAWTLRQIAGHVARVTFYAGYAEQAGRPT